VEEEVAAVAAAAADSEAVRPGPLKTCR